MSVVTTHVLDTAAGRPAAGIPVRLEGYGGALLGDGVTDQDGRVRALGPDTIEAGRYRLVFDTSRYFADPFFPEVVVTFSVTAPDQHYHVPILLSPFAFSTYRGS
ncbi:MAG TPA: hydroxyisourate hydrolase [Pseudonocardiaceae bacterium]|jgi:5-hydroxyisourate hydrolase|nr:hydroxyisourate hydrolase [Pseudonocardiaceae bacterium]